jgi:O-antigen ligase
MMAANVKYGLAIACVAIYAPLVFIDLPVALAIWTGLSFNLAVPALSVAPLAALLLIIFGWLGTLRRADSPTRVLIRAHRGRLLLAAGLMLWILLSLLWAKKPGVAGSLVIEWMTAGVLFVIVATTVRSRRVVMLLLGAFVIGGVISILVGITGIVPNTDFSHVSALESSGNSTRLRGGSGDPNYLAAGLVPAIVIAATMIVSTKRHWARIGLAAALPILLLGLVATESRGAFLAVGVTIVVAMIVARRKIYLASFVVVLLAFGAFWLASSPGAWHRITNIDGEGNGRSDLWQVGWEIAQDHPIVGVGVNNFSVYSPDYVRRPGQLKFVELIAEKSLVVHNTYLQTLTELGIVGLGLMVAIILSSLAAAIQAAREFERRRNMEMANLARGLFIAISGALVAIFFISAETDARFWILYAICPALLVIARSEPMPINGPAPRQRRGPRRRRALSIPTA